MNTFQCVQDAVDNFTSEICLAAEVSESSGQDRRPPALCWSDDCQQAERARKTTKTAETAPHRCDHDSFQKELRPGKC